MMLDGILIFLVIYLFWRINQYEANFVKVNKRMKQVLKIYLKSLPEEERQKIMEEEHIKKEWKN